VQKERVGTWEIPHLTAGKTGWVVRIGKARSRKPMMPGGGKSDEAIVAVKRPNEAERSGEEAVERRAEAKGNAERHSTVRTQSQEQSVTGAELHTANCEGVRNDV
jgi:hypothetical protein